MPKKSFQKFWQRFPRYWKRESLRIPSAFQHSFQSMNPHAVPEPFGQGAHQIQKLVLGGLRPTWGNVQTGLLRDPCGGGPGVKKTWLARQT